MTYNLDRYGFKKMTEQWFFYSDNSGMMHICNPEPDSTGIYPKRVGTPNPDGSCGECGEKLPPELQIIYNLQSGFRSYHEDGSEG